MRSHLLLYRTALAKRVNAGGPFSPGEIAAIAHTLAGALPAALVRRLANIRRVRQTPRSLIPSMPATAAFRRHRECGRERRPDRPPPVALVLKQAL